MKLPWCDNIMTKSLNYPNKRNQKKKKNCSCDAVEVPHETVIHGKEKVDHVEEDIIFKGQ